MKSPFLSHLHHAYAQTDSSYAYPNSREGDMLRQAKKEIEELELKLSTLGELAVANWDDPTVGEIDKLVQTTKYKDMLHTLFVKNPQRIRELEAENAALLEDVRDLVYKNEKLQEQLEHEKENQL